MEVKSVKETDKKEVAGQETDKLREISDMAKQELGDQKELTMQEADELLKKRLEDGKPEVSEELNRGGSQVTFGRLYGCEKKCADEEHPTSYRGH